MTRWPLAATLVVVAVAGAVGIRMWMDSRGAPGGADELTDEFRPNFDRHPLGSPADVSGPEDGIGSVDSGSADSHIGEPLDPDAVHVRRGAEVRHLGNFLSPVGDHRVRGDPRPVHIGTPRDPDDDWRPLPDDVVRHIGEPLEPDVPPIGEPSMAHIGEPLPPPGEN